MAFALDSRYAGTSLEGYGDLVQEEPEQLELPFPPISTEDDDGQD